jgi:EmrB/QacA subfamily drug resistance transporter
MHGRPAAESLGAPRESHPRRWRILVVLLLALLVTSIDHTIINVALPSLAIDLGASSAGLQWVVDSYTLVFAGLLLIAGALGDRFGRRGALALGLATFAVGSVVAAAGASVTSVIAGRAVMGIGGALIMPATLSILVNVFGDPRERAKAIGIWAAVSGAGIAIGPIVGGALMTRFAWPSVFWINLPLVLAALVTAFYLVPRSRADRSSRLDPVGAVLSIAAITAVTYAVIEAPEHGWTSATTLTVFAAGLATAVGFVHWELRRAEPLLDVRLFRMPAFTAASLSLTLLFFAMAGAMFLQAQYLQFVLGFSALGAGAALVPAAVGMLAGTVLGSHLSAARGARLTVASGTLVGAVGLGLQAVFTDGGSYLPTGIGLFLFGLGAGAAMPAATDSIMSTLPAARAGVGSAVNDTTRELGGVLGVAVVGSVAATAYSIAMQATTLTGPALPDAVRTAVDDSIAAAMAVSADLGRGGAGLAAVAQDAFVNAMGGALWVAAAFAVWATVIAAVHLPRAPQRGLPDALPPDTGPEDAASIQPPPASAGRSR